MRRYLLSLLVGLTALAQDSSLLDDPAWLGSVTLGTTPAACETTDTALPHDTLLEGWPTGFDNPGATWITNTTGGTVEIADTTLLTTNKPDGACNEGLKVVWNAAVTYLEYDYGSSIDIDTVNLDIYFSIYVDAIDTGDIIRCFSCGTSTTPGASAPVQLQITESAGTIAFVADGAVDSASVSGLALDRWHNIMLHLDTTAESSYMTVNGGAHQAFTRAAADVRYCFFGATASVGAGESGTFYYDVFSLNTP